MGLLKLDSFSTQQTNTNESHLHLVLEPEVMIKVWKDIFHNGGQSCWGPLKQTIQVVNMARQGKGGCDFKARSDKKENCTEHRRTQRPHPNKTENLTFFAGTSEQQEHDMEKKSLMENAKAKSSHSSSSVSALKQMEQMMGRNYSDFMRSLAAKYNQTSTKE